MASDQNKPTAGAEIIFGYHWEEFYLLLKSFLQFSRSNQFQSLVPGSHLKDHTSLGTMNTCISYLWVTVMVSLWGHCSKEHSSAGKGTQISPTGPSGLEIIHPLELGPTEFPDSICFIPWHRFSYIMLAISFSLWSQIPQDRINRKSPLQQICENELLIESITHY